jgi:hypothetical protein
LEVVAVVVGFLLGLLPGRFADRRKAIALLTGLRLEIDHGADAAGAYLKDAKTHPIWSPAYRIDVGLFNTTLASLAELGSLSASESAALHQFRIYADEANRCLDYLADMRPLLAASDVAEAAKQETGRAGLKFEHVAAQAAPALAAIDSALARSRRFWQPIFRTARD